MDTATAYTKFQAGEITLTELSAIAEANAKAQAEAENIARHGTANSITINTAAGR